MLVPAIVKERERLERARENEREKSVERVKRWKRSEESRFSRFGSLRKTQVIFVFGSNCRSDYYVDRWFSAERNNFDGT